MSDRTIILIGGMPTAGKSTIAKQLGHKLKLPVFSTDQVRTIMEAVVTPADYPLLLNARGFTAETFLSRYTPAEIADMQYRQAGEVWPAIKYFIDHDWVWSDGFIIEGINITPQHAKDFADKDHVRAVFVSDNDRERVREVIVKRGLFGPPADTPDHLKRLEAEWTLLFDQMIRRDATVHGATLVDIAKSDTDLTRVMRAIGFDE